MAVKVKLVRTLKEYFSGVRTRSEHHAPNVDEVIYPLLGFIVLHMDEDAEIEVRGSEGAIGNILWISINNVRYAFRYEHEDDSIEIRKDSYQGDVVAKIDNGTAIGKLKRIFDTL